MGQHATRILRQIRQQLEFLRGQPNLDAIPQDAKSRSIDDEVAAHDRVARRRRRFDASQRRADTRQQLIRAERLGHVIVGACIEGAHLVRFGATC